MAGAKQTGWRNVVVRGMFCLAVFLICFVVLPDLYYPYAHNRSLAAPASTIRQLAVLEDAGGTDKSLLRMSADGQLFVTGTGRGPVKLWEMQSGKFLADLHGTEGQAPRAFSPVDDRLLISDTLKSLSLYDLKTMQLVWYVKLGKLLGSLNFFDTFSPNGELFIVDSLGKNKVTVWETKTARMITSRHCSDPVFKSTFSPESKRVLTSCGDRKAMLWDAQTGNVIAEFTNPDNVLRAVFNPDNKSVTTIDMSGHVVVWDAATGQMKSSWGRDCQIYYATFSPDNKILATVGWNGIVDLWDVESQKLRRQLRISRGATHVNFSSDSRFLTANGHTGEVAVWNVADGSPVLNITEHQKDINYVLFSSDNHLVISYSADAMNVWDLVSKAHVAKLDAILLGVSSKDGKLLVLGGQKKTVILWEITP
jgi:WD40 repeat protein